MGRGDGEAARGGRPRRCRPRHARGVRDIRGLPDPGTAFGDAEYVRTRFRAAPDCAWAAEVDGEVVGSVFAARWGTFGSFGPLTTHPDVWDRGVGSRLMEPVLEAFGRWQLRQAGLFTFPNSPKHIGLYQKHGFWPRFLTAVTAKPVTGPASECATFSQVPAGAGSTLEAIRELTDAVFPGLDLERELWPSTRSGSATRCCSTTRTGSPAWRSATAAPAARRGAATAT